MKDMYYITREVGNGEREYLGVDGPSGNYPCWGSIGAATIYGAYENKNETLSQKLAREIKFIRENPFMHPYPAGTPMTVRIEKLKTEVVSEFKFQGEKA